MIDLGSTEFLLAVPSVQESELEKMSTSLFDSWESFVEDSLVLPDYSLFLQVEEGSIKGSARIGAVLGAVYIGIGNYGSFISGLKTINEQLNATREYISTQAERVFFCPKSKNLTQKHGGSLASLQRLFVSVQKGDLTPDEALIRAETLIGDDFSIVPGFRKDLENSLRTCPHFHEQLTLRLGGQEENNLSELENIKTPIRPSRPRGTIGPPLQLRVEVWRESKEKRKQTRTIRL